MRVALALALSACGRIGFGEVGGGGGGSTVDAQIVDGITVTAPCGTPVQIGESVVTAGELHAGLGGTSYRVTWIDDSSRVHLLGIERTGDSITTTELVLPLDLQIPSPLGSDVAIAGDTYLVYWNGVQAQIDELSGPDFRLVHGVSTSGQHGVLAASGAAVYTLALGNKLNFYAWTDAIGLVTFSQIDQKTTIAQNMAATAGSSVLVAAAHSTQSTCTLWTYSSSGALLGTANVPSDNTQCGWIASAYASVDNVLAVAYVYESTASPYPVLVQQLSATAQPIGLAPTLATGNLPLLASSGSHFYLAYRTAGTGTPTYNVVTMSSVFASQSDVPLHDPSTQIQGIAVASGDSEAIAVWAEAGTPAPIWMRRFCGP